MPPKYTNVVALIREKERYYFLYDDESSTETMRALGRFASNPELSFTWHDAAVLSQRIREDKKRHEELKFNRDLFFDD